MTFDSIEALKSHILSESKGAIIIAQERVYRVIDGFLKKFYSEFDPSLYDRTQQLMRSLVKSNIVSTGNGWSVEIYFDLSRLDYSIKTLKGIGTWGNTFKREDWTKENDEWVLETAMIGSRPHGDYASGTAIWTESINVLHNEGIEILKQELIKAGIPVK